MPSVSEILLEAGRQAALSGYRRGQIFGNMAERLGQVPNEVIAQHRQRERQQQESEERTQRLKLGALALGKGQREAEQQTALDSIWGDPGIYDDKGEFNRTALLDRARKANPALVPHVTDVMDKAETAADLRRQREQALMAHDLDTNGELADLMLSRKDGIDVPTFHLAVSKLAKSGSIPTAEADRLTNLQTADEVRPVLESWRSLSPKLREEQRKQTEEETKPFTLKPGETRFGRPDASGKPPVVAEAPEAFTLAPGDVRYRGGVPVASAPTKEEPVAVQDPSGHVRVVGTVPKGTHFVPQPPRITVTNPSALQDVKDAVAGMKEGTIPPILPGRATKEYLATLAEAKRQKYDLQAAVTDWNATQKHIATMNGAQQLRLNQAINSLPEMLDKIDALASQWKGGRFPLLNKANLVAAKNGAYGQDVASVANKLDAQIADVTADLGNVYMGGNSPTDHALELAGKSLKGDWSEKVLHDMTQLARDNVQIRKNSIKHTGVAGASPTNPYGNQPDTSSGVVEWTRDANGNPIPKPR